MSKGKLHSVRPRILSQSNLNPTERRHVCKQVRWFVISKLAACTCNIRHNNNLCHCQFIVFSGLNKYEISEYDDEDNSEDDTDTASVEDSPATAESVAAERVQCVQCDRCGKWRELATAAKLRPIDNWFCELNTDGRYSSCDVVEQEWSDDDDSEEHEVSDRTSDDTLPSRSLAAEVEAEVETVDITHTVLKAATASPVDRRIKRR